MDDELPNNWFLINSDITSERINQRADDLFANTLQYDLINQIMKVSNRSMDN